MSAPERLLRSLAAARAALDENDPALASAALDGVTAACAELTAAGARLDPETVRNAVALHGECTTAALAVQRALSGKLEQAAGARRAARAYAG